MNGLQLYSVEKMARELIHNGPACYRPAYLAPNPFSRFRAAHVEEPSPPPSPSPRAPDKATLAAGGTANPEHYSRSRVTTRNPEPGNRNQQ